MVTEISREKIKEFLSYNAETGDFTWIKTNLQRAVAGAKAGSKGTLGYITIGLDGAKLYAHRLAWIYVYGYCPKLVDHINRDKSDNRIANLRAATHNQNLANADHSKRANPESAVGVVKPKGGLRRWRARVGKIHIGYFDTLEEAVQAREAMRREMFGEFATAGT